MPPRLLPIEHIQQEMAAGCLAACAQMVLRYLGIEQSQRHLNRLLGLTAIGTRYTNIRRLSQFGLRVTMEEGNDTGLRQVIDRDLPAIAFVLTGDLPYWQANTPHAVVVAGYDPEHLFLHDPAFAIAAQGVPWGDFMLAWSEMDTMYALIER